MAKNFFCGAPGDDGAHSRFDGGEDGGIELETLVARLRGVEENARGDLESAAEKRGVGVGHLKRGGGESSLADAKKGGFDFRGIRVVRGLDRRQHAVGFGKFEAGGPPETVKGEPLGEVVKAEPLTDGVEVDVTRLGDRVLELQWAMGGAAVGFDVDGAAEGVGVIGVEIAVARNGGFGRDDAFGEGRGGKQGLNGGTGLIRLQGAVGEGAAIFIGVELRAKGINVVGIVTGEGNHRENLAVEGHDDEGDGMVFVILAAEKMFAGIEQRSVEIVLESGIDGEEDVFSRDGVDALFGVGVGLEAFVEADAAGAVEEWFAIFFDSGLAHGIAGEITREVAGMVVGEEVGLVESFRCVGEGVVVDGAKRADDLGGGFSKGGVRLRIGFCGVMGGAVGAGIGVIDNGEAGKIVLMLAEIVCEIVGEVMDNGMETMRIAEVDFFELGIAGVVDDFVFDRRGLGILPVVVPGPKAFVERDNPLADLLETFEDILLR